MGEKASGIHRRAVLGSVGAAVLGGLAGCTTVANWIGDKVLGDVNLFNDTTDRLEGSIQITDPEGATALDDAFDLPPNEEDESGDSAGDEEEAGIFEDVWTESGTYEVSVTLDDGSEVKGTSEAGAAVTIDDPDEEMLAVLFGADASEDGIRFATGEELTELMETDGN